MIFAFPFLTSQCYTKKYLCIKSAHDQYWPVIIPACAILLKTYIYTK